MRIPRRPALPVVFLCLAGIGAAGPPETAALGEEIARWSRIRRPEGPAAQTAFEQAFADAAEGWTARWPGEELAWRERLRALEKAPATPAEVEQALEGAARSLDNAAGLRFPEDTRFLMARAAVRHSVRLGEARDWVQAAVERVAHSVPAGEDPLSRAYCRERLSEARWRKAEILAEAGYRAGDAAALHSHVVALTAEASVPIADPADRIALAESARRRSALFLWRARLARLSGDEETARRRYQSAVEARPTTPGAPEPPENTALLDEAERFAGMTAGPGTPIPPAIGAGPHWLPTSKPLEGFIQDGRPAIAVIWDAADPRQARALGRLERQQRVRILRFDNADAAWIAAVNPLYSAPQLWLVDAEGQVRLVGRMQPGGDGWEDAVVGAALRL